MTTRICSALRSSLIVLAAALATAGAASAKPLYITVPRTFGTDERPVVDVAFESRGPVELRILQPTDADAFLRKQANLRRAYEPTKAMPNPGHALSRALNAVHGPGTFLLNALTPAVREVIAPALPKRPEAPAHPVSRLALGPEKLVAVPPGMVLVKSQYLNLDLGGLEREFHVPGFEGWYDPYSGYQERRVSLAPLPAGLYVLQLVQGRIEGQVVLVVTDLTVQVKQTDGTALLRVAGRDQLPRANARVAVRLPGGEGGDGAGTVGPTATTDANGEARLSVTEPRLLISVRAGNDLAVVDTDFYSTLAVAPDVFIYTDRPIYRPGDEVHFRGLVRKPDSFLARLFAPKHREVSVQLLTQSDGAHVGTRASIDAFGSFAGSFQVPEGLDSGVLRVSATLDDQAYQAEARVKEYVKPTFFVEVLPESESVTPGQALKAKVRARRYAGGPVPGARHEVFLYRSQLDTPSWVDDAGLGGKGSAVTYGSQATTEGKLSIPEQLYSTLAAREEARFADDPWATAAKLDEQGEATLEIPVPELKPGEERIPFRYSLTVRARDDQNSLATGAQSYFLSDCDVVGAVRPSAPVVKAAPASSTTTTTTGSAATMFAVRATSLSGKPMPNVEGRAQFVLRRADGGEKALSEQPVKTGDDGVWRAAAPTDKAGTVVARVTLKDARGRPWEGEASLLVLGEPGEPVARVPSLTLQLLGEALAPGDTAELAGLLPEGWGPQGRDAGSVWITLTGSGLFDTQRVEVSGTTLIHRFDIERRFGSAVYASVAYPTASGRWEERTAPFRIVPAERILSVAVQPREAELKPLSVQTVELRVTDNTGAGRVAQVSVGVVDKAIYAVQAEFRPKVLDFFYPLGRDNVTTFYSSDFQGLGYGEPLAKALARLPGVRFAAIKPPTARRQEDLAFWTPFVVTDEQGYATVSFPTPSNATIWVVTALAADAAGRFGESTAEFATRGGVSLVAAVPAFLRQGDEAIATVRIARPGGDTAAAAGMAKQLDLKLEAAGALGAATASQAVELGAAGAPEKIVSFPIRAAQQAGTGEVKLVAKGGEDPLADRKTLAVRPAAVEEQIAVSALNGGVMTLPLAPGARAQSVELILQPTAVDLALSSVRDLLDYPYGGLDALAFTTIPNVAVYRVFEKTGALDKLDAESKAMLAEARSRAVQGVDRILELSVKGGGFTRFRGYATPSVPVTLLALDALGHAVDAGLADRGDERIVASARWLEEQTDLPPAWDVTRAYVLARLEGPRQAARVRAIVESVEPSDLYGVALAALAAESAGIAKEPALQQKLRTLAAREAQPTFDLADWSPTQWFWAYPLRRIGLAAILTHAAVDTGVLDPEVARTRLISLLSNSARLSAFDRGALLLHSLWLLERDAKTMRAMTPPEVTVDTGGAAPRLVPRGAGLAATLSPEAKRVEVKKFDGVATLRARVATPLAAVQPASDGMTLQRAYYALRGDKRVPLEPGATVSQGEEVFVELRLDAHAGEAWSSMRSAYYVVEDAIPAGFVALDEDKPFRGVPFKLPLDHEALKRRAFGTERATFWFEEPAWWSATPRVFGYVLRAQYAGRFSAPPATVTDLYAPAIRARTGAAELRVKPSGQPVAEQ